MASIEDVLASGVEHHRAGRLAEAEAEYRRILAVNPNEPRTLQLLGVLAHHCGQSQAGVQLILRAIQLAGENTPAEFYGNLGEAYRALQLGDDAIKAFEAAIRIDPNFAQPHNGLGVVLAMHGRTSEAAKACGRALELTPQDGEVLNNIGNIHLDAGRPREAVEAHRRATALSPENFNTHSNLLRDMSFVPEIGAAELAEEHRAWWRRFGGAGETARVPFANDRDPERRLRVGYVSPDFRQHSVAYFLLPLLDAHDRGQVELFFYGDIKRGDAVTLRVQAAGQLRNTMAWNLDQIEQAIRADRIDVLVDLAGHTAGNRLPLFARRPAPVQLSYLGYPMPTGVETMDCWVTDGYVDPPGSAGDGEERVCRLEPCAWCYSPEYPAPEVVPTASEDGRVRFGSFNHLAKLSDPCVRLWARVLSEAADSILLLKSNALIDAGVREEVYQRFQQHGIGRERVTLLQQQLDFGEHLAQYAKVDIGLDPFPYNGTTTTCEAMYMGVPVITLAGHQRHGRVGISLLNNVGLPDLVAEDEDAYVAIARSLAADSERRSKLRMSLRRQMQASPLMDAPLLARGMGRIMRGLWRTWCESSR